MKKKNKILVIVLSIVLCVALLGAGTFVYASDVVKKNSIGIDAAIDAAMSDAGCTEENTIINKAKLTFEDGTFAYEVEFVSGGTEYEYLLKASDGTILSRESENADKDQQDTNPASTSETNDNATSSAVAADDSTVNTAGANDEASTITLEKAKEIALADAGLSASSVTFTQTKKDYDDGVGYYEVEFYTSSYEYEYEISLTGQILSVDKDPIGTGSNNGNNTGSNDSSNISVTKAKEIALKDAGVSSSNATFTKAKKDYDDGVSYYEIEFYTSSYEYEYEISLKGKILSKEKEPRGNTGNNGGSNDSSNITLSEAKTIALKDAGVSSSKATFTKAKKDYDDGVSYYEIEFYTSSYEYEYEISLKGKILSVDKDPRKTGSGDSTSKPDETKYIGVDKAKSIALNHAGLSSSSVKFTKAKLEKEDGRMVYEIEFETSKYEYEYEIDAKTGKIISHDVEGLDDDD